MRGKHSRHAAVAAAVVALLIAHLLLVVPVLRGWPWPALAAALVLAVLVKFLVWRARSRKWPFRRSPG